MHRQESGGTGCKVLLNGRADTGHPERCNHFSLFGHYAHGSTSAIPKCKNAFDYRLSCDSSMPINFLFKKIGACSKHAPNPISRDIRYCGPAPAGTMMTFTLAPVFVAAVRVWIRFGSMPLLCTRYAFALSAR